MSAKKMTLKDGIQSVYPQTTDDVVFFEKKNNKTLRKVIEDIEENYYTKEEAEGYVDNEIAGIIQRMDTQDASLDSSIVAMVTEYNISLHQKNMTTGSPRYDTSIFTLQEAIAQVPDDIKRGGLKLTFNSSSSNDSSLMDHVETYDLNSNIWSNDVSKWYRNDGKYNREEISQLSLDVNGVLYPNYFENKYVDKDGNIVDAQYWGVTSFIPYSGGNVYWLAGYTSGSRCLVFYDNNFIPIADAFYGASSEEIIIQQEEIQADARYIRTSYFLSAESPYVKIGDVVVWDSSKKSDGLIARVEELEYLKNEVAKIKPNNATITEDIKIGQDGYYIDADGNRQPYASYGISEIIHLLKGDVL